MSDDYYYECCCFKAPTRNVCLRLYYALPGLIIVLVIIVLIVVGVEIIDPWRRTQGLLSSQCKTLNVSSSDSWPWLSCSTCTGGRTRSGCRASVTSKQPCMQLFVQYNFSVGQVPAVGLLFESNHEYLRTSLPQCSYLPGCEASEWLNKRTVQGYVDQWGKPGTSFSCFYNPTATRKVLRKRKFSDAVVIHLMLWPMVIIAVCFIIITLAYGKFGCGMWSGYCSEVPFPLVQTASNRRNARIRFLYAQPLTRVGTDLPMGSVKGPS